MIGEEISRYEPKEVPRIIGVDRGVSTLYYAGAVYATPGDETGTEREVGALCNDGDLSASTHFEHSDQLRNTRERLAERRDRFQEAGALDRVKEMGDHWARVTENELHRASAELIEFAREHAPCAIAFEDLTSYRQSADEPIHDWPYRAFEEKVKYKAHAERIPVIDDVESAGTSTECYRCGAPGERPYRGNYSRFYCYECEKEINADLNAAFNVALRPIKKVN